MARLGGLARAKALTAEQRQDIARKAGKKGGAAGKGKRKPRKDFSPG